MIERKIKVEEDISNYNLHDLVEYLNQKQIPLDQVTFSAEEQFDYGSSWFVPSINYLRDETKKESTHRKKQQRAYELQLKVQEREDYERLRKKFENKQD